MDIKQLTEIVIKCAFRVHNTLGSGYLEKVYENALRLDLEAEGLHVQQQAPIQVRYRGQVVGDFIADLVVEGRLIVEIKAVQKVAVEHEVQLVNYLTATGMDDGLLINFGPSVEVRHKYRVYRPRASQSSS
ncbi:MAG: GxxExxY protein [Candidatus Brachytrichaceae bacterium NZ_4S206]|jgi:GxxExxY protein